jgi:hypothetical protein
MNEYGEPVRPGQATDFPVRDGEPLQLKISLQTAGSEDEDGNVMYGSLPSEPQFLLTNTGDGGTFDIRYVEKIDNPDKVYKKRRPTKKYRRDKLKTGPFTSKVFRIGKVEITIGATNFVAEGDTVAENGFRIIVFMLDAS